MGYLVRGMFTYSSACVSALTFKSAFFSSCISSHFPLILICSLSEQHNYMKYNYKRSIAFYVVMPGCGVSVCKTETEQVSWERRGVIALLGNGTNVRR